MSEFVYEYWSKTELGRKMIANERVSYSDLLFLIPNNIKRRHKLPTTRIHGKNKSTKKKWRRKRILSSELFDIIEETIEELLPTKITNEFFDTFVEFKNVGKYSDGITAEFK